MLTVPELAVQLKTFRTEVESRLKSLELASLDAQTSISSAADRLINSLDDRVKSLDINAFLDDHEGDMERAVQDLASNHLRQQQQRQQSARGGNTVSPDATNKKRKRPGSPSRQASTTTKRAKGTTLRLSCHTPLKATGAVRRPRRGESIVLQSANGSPLGSMIAESSAVTPSDDTEDREEGDEWDLMDAAEASRIENMDPSLKKGSSNNYSQAKRQAKQQKRPAKATSASASKNNGKGNGVPASTSFVMKLPPDAPDYAAALERQAAAVKEMMATLRETLAATEMSDQDRKRIERLENKLFKDLTI